WAAWGLFVWWRSRQDRPDCGFVLASLILLPLFLSAYPNWHGGWSLGSRYLVPLVLLAALPVGRALETGLSRGAFLAAAAFSVVQLAILTLTWPSFPIDVPWPVATGSRWFLERGWVASGIVPSGFVGDVFSVLLLFGVVAVALVAAIQVALPVSPRPEV